MKRVMYNGLDVGVSSDVKAAAYMFRMYCVTLHKEIFNCEDLKDLTENQLQALCARRELFKQTGNRDSSVTIIETDDWFVVYLGVEGGKETNVG